MFKLNKILRGLKKDIEQSNQISEKLEAEISQSDLRTEREKMIDNFSEYTKEGLSPKYYIDLLENCEEHVTVKHHWDLPCCVCKGITNLIKFNENYFTNKPMVSEESIKKFSHSGYLKYYFPSYLSQCKEEKSKVIHEFVNINKYDQEQSLLMENLKEKVEVEYNA